MAEDDGLTGAPVLVEDLDAVLGRDRAHATLSLVVVVVLLGLRAANSALSRQIGREQLGKLRGVEISEPGDSDCSSRSSNNEGRGELHPASSYDLIISIKSIGYLIKRASPARACGDPHLPSPRPSKSFGRQERTLPPINPMR